MSKNMDQIDKFIQERIIEENIEDVFATRFARYSKAIIQDRALPDVRDGLKPVQRRILYAMYKIGVFSNKGYKKSARIVGDVIGKYHPHGDSSIYDALVRMSQDFKMRLPLIDMHGNNGSIDGDPAAAMRYTECRLSKYAEMLLKDIDKRTVGFVPNFDDEELEPVVLPAKFPNILVNGATGISAGYATEIPPHNIDEVINATIYRIDHPNCSLDELMVYVQGPDFPTGGIVQGEKELKKAYKTGRGKIIVRAKSDIIEGKKINQIVFTEIPYGVNKGSVVKKMSEVYVDKNIAGIIEVRDETDREGLKIVVDLEKGVDPKDIRDFFYKMTELQINYSFNVTCISDKHPKSMGLAEILDAYINHQKEVTTNRCNYELEFARRRAHIVDGLIMMTSILDAVIQTIRNSKNKKDAKDNLMNFYGFTELQAEAIVMLQLYRLTNTDIFALEEEAKELEEKIKSLEKILEDESSLMGVIKDELTQTLKALSSPRKTKVEAEIDTIVIEQKELIIKEDVRVLVTYDGYLKRIGERNYNSDLGEAKYKDDDFLLSEFKVTTADTILFFTSLGNYVYLPVKDIPDARHRDLGYNISTLVKIEAKEKIIFAYPVTNFDEETYFLFTTANGLTKRTVLKDFYAVRYSRALKATQIRKGDRLVSVDVDSGARKEVVMITEKGYMNRYNADEISIMAPPSFGVKAMELKSRPDDIIVAGLYVDRKDEIVCLGKNNTITTYKPNDINKGRKNNVGKAYLEMTRTSDNTYASANVVRKEHNPNNLSIFCVSDKGFDTLEYKDVKGSSNRRGKKISKSDLGTMKSLIVFRNNSDFGVDKKWSVSTISNI